MVNSFLPNNINSDKLKDIPFIFVIGRPRSGTTLLRTLLDAHSNVIIPFESPIILRMARKYAGVNKYDDKMITSFFSDLKLQKKFDTWPLDQKLLEKNLSFVDYNIDYQTLVKFVYSHFISVFNKDEIKYIGDKNPHYASSINRIFSLFPNARYIHITRDYRDNILSNLKFEFGTSRKSLLAYRWKESILKMNKLKNKFPDQFYTLRYEDLVDTPSEKMQEICSFMGIDYQPDVLNFHEMKDEVMKSFPPNLLDRMIKFQSNLFRPINKSAVGKWKTDLSDKDIRIADMVVGRVAEETGYERKYSGINIFLYLQLFPIIGFYRLKQSSRYLFKKYMK